MVIKELVILALLGLSVANDTTVSLFLPGAERQRLVGSIVASDATATTYVIQCTVESTPDCGYPEPFTLIEGPATLKYRYGSYGKDQWEGTSGELNCQLFGTTSAICTQGFGGRDVDNHFLRTRTLGPADVTYIPILITTAPNVAILKSGAATTLVADTNQKVVSRTRSAAGADATSAGNVMQRAPIEFLAASCAVILALVASL